MTGIKRDGVLKRIWIWLREFDETIHTTEADHLRKEVKHLRSEVEKLRNRRFDQ